MHFLASCPLSFVLLASFGEPLASSPEAHPSQEGLGPGGMKNSLCSACLSPASCSQGVSGTESKPVAFLVTGMTVSPCYPAQTKELMCGKLKADI